MEHAYWLGTGHVQSETTATPSQYKKLNLVRRNLFTGCVHGHASVCIAATQSFPCDTTPFNSARAPVSFPEETTKLGHVQSVSFPEDTKPHGWRQILASQIPLNQKRKKVALCTHPDAAVTLPKQHLKPSRCTLACSKFHAASRSTQKMTSTK